MVTRRRILHGTAATVAVLACGRDSRSRGGKVCTATLPAPVGPYYLDGAPERSELAIKSTPGRGLLVRGRVVTTSCTPIAGATLDVWQADSAGRYSEQGFHLRGRVRTDSGGGFEFSSIVPGRYRDGGSLRPAHVHITVTSPGHEPLTTQLYFPGDPHSEGDPHWKESLVAATRRREDGTIVATVELVLGPGR